MLAWAEGSHTRDKGITVEHLLSKLSWPAIILLCLTLGLAPFNPPHIWEKLRMLFSGRLVRAIDWFDLFFHAFPWILLMLKGIFTLQQTKGQS